MNKIEFFKNNRKIEIDNKSIKFFNNELKVIKENEESIIVLDFIKKECQFTLKSKNISIKIKVLEMACFNEKNQTILTYILESEPEVKNTLKFMN